MRDLENYNSCKNLSYAVIPQDTTTNFFFSISMRSPPEVLSHLNITMRSRINVSCETKLWVK